MELCLNKYVLELRWDRFMVCAPAARPNKDLHVNPVEKHPWKWLLFSDLVSRVRRCEMESRLFWKRQIYSAFHVPFSLSDFFPFSDFYVVPNWQSEPFIHFRGPNMARWWDFSRWLIMDFDMFFNYSGSLYLNFFLLLWAPKSWSKPFIFCIRLMELIGT